MWMPHNKVTLEAILQFLMKLRMYTTEMALSFRSQVYAREEIKVQIETICSHMLIANVFVIVKVRKGLPAKVTGRPHHDLC